MSNAIEAVRWTMADHLSGTVGEFLTLGGITFSDPDDGELFWNDLLEDPNANAAVDDFNLQADLIVSDGTCIGEKYVTRELIERYLDVPFEEAVERARQENLKLEDQTQNRFRASHQ